MMQKLIMWNVIVLIYVAVAVTALLIVRFA